VRRIALISFSLLLIFAKSARDQEPRAGNIFAPYSFKAYDQQEYPAELGKLWVAENRSSNNGRLIQLAFVRLKTTAENPQPPIVFLAGGPGVPGTGMGRVPDISSCSHDCMGKVFEAALAAKTSGRGRSGIDWSSAAIRRATSACVHARAWLTFLMSVLSRRCLDKVNSLISKMTVETLNLRTNMLVNVAPDPAR
jgi:hypothetical protein